MPPKSLVLPLMFVLLAAPSFGQPPAASGQTCQPDSLKIGVTKSTARVFPARENLLQSSNVEVTQKNNITTANKHEIRWTKKPSLFKRFWLTIAYA